MHTLKKKICSLLACFVSILSFTACNNPIINLLNKHQHEWEYFIVTQPTCSNIGILEKNCKVCGEKTYDEITPTGHEYLNDVCKICGNTKTQNDAFVHIQMPSNANNSAKWTLNDIYDKTLSFGIIKNEEEFYQALPFVLMQETSLNDLGMLNLTISYMKSEVNPVDIPLSLVVGRVNIVNPTPKNLSNIYRVSFSNNNMYITYTDGTQITAGEIFSQTQTTYINGFGINKNNELVVYYNDDTVAFAGTISESSTNNNQAGFLYAEENNSYTVFGVLNKKAETMEIPFTHRGRPVTKVAYNTFHNMQNLKKVIIGKNVANISHLAFRVCPNLESVIIPAGVDISPKAFSDELSACNKQMKIYLEGTPSDYNLVDNWNNGFTYYFSNQWRYVNGIPTAY